MADDQITAAQAVQGTPPAEGSETTKVESQVQTQNQGEESQTDATSDTQDGGEGKTSSGETEDQLGQEAKPSRVERRIQSLISKVKEVKTTSDPIKDVKQSFFTEEDMDNGVDPKVLEERIERRIQSEVQQAIQMEKINREYESAVKDHETDLESITDLDADLEAEAIEQYNLLNYQMNPVTGEEMFIPAVKLSEIVNKIQTRANKLAEVRAKQIAEGNATYIKEVSSSQAIPTTGRVNVPKTVKPDTSDFKEFEKAYSRKS